MVKKQTIYLGADHAGFKTKEKIKEFLSRKKISYQDFGTNSLDSVDYPDYARKVAKAVVKNKSKNARGILICGSGTGMVMAANRIHGVRAVAAYDNYSAKMSRIDNNSNILCLRGRQFSIDKIKNITNTWLNTNFSKKPRHKRRINKLDG